jgi:hypothetical protein
MICPDWSWSAQFDFSNTPAKDASVIFQVVIHLSLPVIETCALFPLMQIASVLLSEYLYYI